STTGWASSPSESLRKKLRNETDSGQLRNKVSAEDTEIFNKLAVRTARAQLFSKVTHVPSADP
ncbi:MAG: hypothetical protein DWQ28_02105, partial [Proteobacteria bacterium]